MKTAVCLRLAPIAVLLASIAAPTALQSQSGAKSSGATADAAIGIRLSTLGLGLELGKQLGDHISARVGINFGSISQNGKKQTDLTYDVSLKLKAAEALIDYSPSKRGVFHFTAGLLTNPLTISGVGTPSGSGTFTINGNTYTRAQVGTLSTTSKFPGAMPYLGLGFGTPAIAGDASSSSSISAQQSGSPRWRSRPPGRQAMPRFRRTSTRRRPRRRRTCTGWRHIR